jgi:hypothetical protein
MLWLIPLLTLLGSLAVFRYEVRDWLWAVMKWELPEDPRPAGVSDLEWASTNYSDEVTKLSNDLELPYEYLMALIVLECSGNKPAGHRFEKGVFSVLRKVKEGRSRKFENIRMESLQGCDDECLTNLATSWGPFQLMGYKVIPLGLDVDDIREEESAALHAAEWIKKEYGHFLKKKKWKDAFHYHNTGDRFPLSGRSRTHDPYYVSDGLKYMKHFNRNLPSGAYSLGV